jgi:hypothetical protein
MENLLIRIQKVAVMNRTKQDWQKALSRRFRCDSNVKIAGSNSIKRPAIGERYYILKNTLSDLS